MNNPKLSRRRFLKNTAGITVGAIGFPYIVPSSALGKAGSTAPSNRVTIGSIGVGGRGALNTRSLLNHGGQVLAVCDVNRDRRKKMKEYVEDFCAQKTTTGTYKGCAAYNHFRSGLERDDIDAVMIATPDHWHVPIAIEAVKAGKDIYVEKPLGMTIDEGRTLRDLVLRYGAVFQHGTELRAAAHCRYVCELIRNGRLGRLQRIEVGAPGGKTAPYGPAEPVPQGLDYQLWLGPAPFRPFRSEVTIRHGHYHILDFAATGFLAGWGIHYIDICQWALDTDETGPVEIEGTALFPQQGLLDGPLRWDVNYTYANDVTVNQTDLSKNPHGIRFEGTEGWIHIDYTAIRDAHPKSLIRSVIAPDEIHLFKAQSDDRNFLEAVKNRSRTCSPIQAAHRSTSVCMLGHLACLLGRKLKWDPQKEHFTNDPQANRLLSKSTRPPANYKP